MPMPTFFCFVMFCLFSRGYAVVLVAGAPSGLVPTAWSLGPPRRLVRRPLLDAAVWNLCARLARTYSERVRFALS